MGKWKKVPPKQVIVEKEQRFIYGRECYSLLKFYDEIERSLGLEGIPWGRNLYSLHLLLKGELQLPPSIQITLPFDFIIYDSHYAAAECSAWCDILSVLMHDECVKRGIEVKMKSKHKTNHDLLH